MASRRLVAALASAVITTIAIPAATTTGVVSAAAPPVAFGRIQYDSPGPDNGTNRSLNREYVTVRNTSQRARSLKGWKLRDSVGHTYTFPRFTLRPGAWVRVHTGQGANTTQHLYWGQDDYVWNNSGDVAVLRRPDRSRVDRCAWTSRGDGFKIC